MGIGKARKLPCVLRVINRVPTLLAVSLPWGLLTMGAYSLTKGWHEAAEELTGKGRVSGPDEAQSVLEAAHATLEPGLQFVPQSRVGQATHEARKAYAKELEEDG